MTKFFPQLSRWCVVAVTSGLASGTVISAALAVEENLHFTRHSLNFGLIRSIDIPDSWESSQVKGPPSSRLFDKDGKDLWDCTQCFEICATERVQADLLLRLSKLTKVSHKLELADLASIKALPYFAQFVNGQGDSIVGTIYSAGDRSVLVVVRQGNRNGACQPMAGGGTRRPLIRCAAGVVYIPGNAETLQTIKFRSEVMGDTDHCEDVIRKVLKSIEWQDQ